MQSLYKNNEIHHTSAAARTKVYREAKHFSGSGEPAKRQVVPHERYKPEIPVRRYARYKKSEQGGDLEVRPAQPVLDVRERKQPGDAHRRHEDTDEDEPGRHHVYRNLAEQNHCTGDHCKPCLAPRSLERDSKKVV